MSAPHDLTAAADAHAASAPPAAPPLPTVAVRADVPAVAGTLLDAGDEPLRREWQALPPRARWVFLYTAVLMTAAPGLIGGFIVYRQLPADWSAAALALPVALFGLAIWLADKRYRFTFWKLDEEGFAVRRGRIWQWETRVPITRVQHLDLKRGPLERMHRLASLVVHTAGTRLGGVSVSGLDDGDAERVRDYLAREIERHNHDDDAVDP